MQPKNAARDSAYPEGGPVWQSNCTPPVLQRNEVRRKSVGLGQSLPKFDVRVMSAFHPIATKSRTSRHFGFGPLGRHLPASPRVMKLV
jgi:hypothetical protein